MKNQNNDDEGESDPRMGWKEKIQRAHEMHQAFGGQQMGWRAGFGRRGWMRPAILKFLEEKPMNGIDVMDKMQEMSHGWYRPSPGSIYPTLEQLETEGLIKKNSDMKYELTKAYKEQRGPAGDTETALREIDGTISYLEELKRTDKAKFSKYKERVEDMADRLAKLLK